MSLSGLALKRRVATTLLCAGLTLAGVLGFALMPVAPLPQVDFPTVMVQASLPGASPEVMASTIATPIERSLAQIAGITEMTSSSNLGSTRITIQFDLSRDSDGAARDVQAAIMAARSQLPSGMPTMPTYRKVNPADAPMLVVALTSSVLDKGQIYDAASSILAQRLAQIEGVGQVSLGGSSLPAIRISADTAKLNQQGLDLEQLRKAISTQHGLRPLGSMNSDSQNWALASNGQLHNPEEFQRLILRNNAGALLRLGDVADVSYGLENNRNAGMFRDRPAVLVIINREPGANMLATIDRVRAALPELMQQMPTSIEATIAVDRSPTIRASLREVEKTLLISTLLVVLVVLLFFRNLYATLIPSVVIPIALSGTFAAMYLAGFSLNNLSLMALTIATGFVVDDAIVVLENIMRHREQGKSAWQAAYEGASEVSMTVITMSLALIAVFLPVLLMEGLMGRLFREFALTLSATIVISCIISLTLTPVLSVFFLNKNKKVMEKKAEENNFLERIKSFYARTLQIALENPKKMLAILMAAIALNIYLYQVVPKGFFPQQDNGRIMGMLQGDQSSSFTAMQKKLTDIMHIVGKDPAVATVVGFVGSGQSNAGTLFMALKPKTQRTESADDVIARLRKKTSSVAGAQLILQAVQDVRVGGRVAQAQFQYTLQSDNLEELRAWAGKIRQAFSQSKVLADVNSDQQEKGQQLSLEYDRDALSRYGLRVNDINAALSNAYAQRLVAVVYEPMNQYRIVLEAKNTSASPEINLEMIQIMNPDGKMVALSSVAKWKPSFAPLSVNHQNQFVATTISFNLPPDKSLSDANQEIEKIWQEINVPYSIKGSFQGSAKVFKESLKSQPLLILLAILTLYIVLGILYESYIHPLTILSTLPSAGIGALAALMLCRTEFSVIAVIGILLLIGIVMKNAIMMIDVALINQREKNMPALLAIHDACLLRFRPILMTTCAALLGALPLVFSHAEGGEIRAPLGITIVGGLLVSQILTLYTTPIVFLLLDKFRKAS